MQVVLLRHAETQWNVEQRLQGRADSPLTEQGRAQSRAVGVCLRELRAARIFASPLPRVRETLRVAGQDLYELARFKEELVELDFGEFTGRLKGEIPTDFKLARLRDEWNMPFPAGESLCNVADRTGRFLREVSNVGDQNLFILAHEMVNATIIGHLLQLDPLTTARIRQPQGVAYLVNEGKLEIKMLMPSKMQDVCFVRMRKNRRNE